MEVQISYSVCAKIQKTSDIWKDKKDIGKIMRLLCERKGVEIIEAEACTDHIHMLVSIPPKLSVASFVGYLKGKSSLMIFDRHANLKYKYGNRHFWCRGYYVDNVGKNKKAIEEYIKNQLQEDIVNDQISIKEYIDPFKREKVKNNLFEVIGKVVQLSDFSAYLEIQQVPTPYRGRTNHPLSGWS